MIAASSCLALAVLALGLMIQSRILLLSNNELSSLGRFLRKLVYVSVAVAIALLVVGFVFHFSFDAYIPAFTTLFILGILLFVQSEVLLKPDKLPSLARQLRRSAYIAMAATVILVVAVVVIAMLIGFRLVG